MGNGEPPLKKRHHYVPVLYLKAFTSDGTEDSKMYATDLDTGRQWSSIPNGLAFENKYNSVDGELRADFFEDMLADVEGKTAPIWHRMVSSKAYPDSFEDHGAVLNLLALQETRTKPNRKAIYDLYDAGYKRFHEILTSTPEIFAAQYEKAKAAGVDFPELPPGTTIEDIRQKSRDGSFILTANIPVGFYIDRMFEHATLMLTMFADRKWKVLDFAGCGVEIFTSDDPVCSVWTKKTAPIHPPGFGMPNTVVFIPLSPEAVLVGAYIERFLEVTPSKQLALNINEITVKHSHRFLFSKSSTIDFTNSGERHNSATVEEECRYRQKNSRTSTQRPFVHTFGPMIALSDERDPNYIEWAAV